MRAIIGPKSDIITRLAENMAIPYIPLDMRKFPDREVCPRITEELGEYERVFLFNQLDCKDFYPNRYIMEYYFMIQLLKDMGVDHIDIIIPYLPYGRQDKSFRLGEPYSLKYLLELFSMSGVSRLYTLMAHISRMSDILESKSMRIVNLSAMDPITDYIQDLKLDHPHIVGPDSESAKWVDQVAERLGTDFTVFDKERDINTGEIKMLGDVPNISGRDVVILDDIISTGQTVEKAIRIINKKNPRYIYIIAMHGIFSDNSIERLANYNLEIITSNSIVNPFSKISVENVLVRAIKKW